MPFKKGEGRKPGAVGLAKRAQLKALEELKATILRVQRPLLHSQIGVARGLTYLYVIRTEEKNGRLIKSKPELVTNTDTIEAYLADELDNDGDEYYFMTTKEPDTKAIDSLFDRVHGRARQNVGLDGGEDEKPIAIKTVEDELKNWATKK